MDTWFMVNTIMIVSALLILAVIAINELMK